VAVLEDSIFARPLLRVAVAYWNFDSVRKFCVEIQSAHPPLHACEFEVTVLVCRLAWRCFSSKLLEASLQSLAKHVNFHNLMELRTEDACELLDILTAPLSGPATGAQMLANNQLRRDLRQIGKQHSELEKIPLAVSTRLARTRGASGEPFLLKLLEVNQPLSVDDLAIIADCARRDARILGRAARRVLRRQIFDWLPQYLGTDRSRQELSESSRSALEWIAAAVCEDAEGRRDD
jgi:hypothetical protein